MAAAAGWIEQELLGGASPSASRSLFDGSLSFLRTKLKEPRWERREDGMQGHLQVGPTRQAGPCHPSQPPTPSPSRGHRPPPWLPPVGGPVLPAGGCGPQIRHGDHLAPVPSMASTLNSSASEAWPP